MTKRERPSGIEVRVDLAQQRLYFDLGLERPTIRSVSAIDAISYESEDNESVLQLEYSEQNHQDEDSPAYIDAENIHLLLKQHRPDEYETSVNFVDSPVEDAVETGQVIPYVALTGKDVRVSIEE